MDVIQDKFASHPNGCVTSLDWAHAFDTMRPVVTTEVMKRLNLARCLDESNSFSSI